MLIFRPASIVPSTRSGTHIQNFATLTSKSSTGMYTLVLTCAGGGEFISQDGKATSTNQAQGRRREDHVRTV